jgi:Domain of unknown function (DUF1996)
MRQTILLPASVGIAVLLACALALLAALAAAPAASARSNEHGASFAVRCDYSHRLSDDPIVHFGHPGEAHSHDFLGNTTTNAKSTYQTMTTGIDPNDPPPRPPDSPITTCSRPEDTAGYWFPTLRWNGVVKDASRVVFYYRAGDKEFTTVQTFPKDLRIIADKGVNGARVRWYCGSGGGDDDKAGSADPPTRCSSGVLGLRIIFPDCVAEVNPNDTNLKDVDEVVPGNNYRDGEKIDPATGQVIDPATGQVIDSPNHRSHMARSKPQNDGSRACSDPSYPIPVPTLTINANFQIGTSSGTVTLACDTSSSCAASTIHTDFWNTWDQSADWNPNATNGAFGGLDALVEHCINDVSPTDPRPEPCRAPTATA